MPFPENRKHPVKTGVGGEYVLPRMPPAHWETQSRVNYPTQWGVGSEAVQRRSEKLWKAACICQRSDSSSRQETLVSLTEEILPGSRKRLDRGTALLQQNQQKTGQTLWQMSEGLVAPPVSP